MNFIKKRLNPFHKEEEKFKKAGEEALLRLRNENKSDDEIIEYILKLPEAKELEDENFKAARGAGWAVRKYFPGELRKRVTKAVKNG